MREFINQIDTAISIMEALQMLSHLGHFGFDTVDIHVVLKVNYYYTIIMGLR